MALQKILDCTRAGSTFLDVRPPSSLPARNQLNSHNIMYKCVHWVHITCVPPNPHRAKSAQSAPHRLSTSGVRCDNIISSPPLSKLKGNQLLSVPTEIGQLTKIQQLNVRSH